MAYQLKILTPDGQTLKATRTHANPTGVLGGFAWRWSRYGDCITLNFDAFAPQLGAGNRDILHLTVNGTDVFYGPVVEKPHPRDPRRGQIDVVGASRLLAARVIGRDTYENVDVAVVVRDLIQKYRHPAITYNPARIPDTGKILSRFRMPWRKLDQVLLSLSKSVAGEKGVPMGVLANGEFFFGVDQAPAVPIAYSSVRDLRYLRVSGDDVVTRNYMLAMSGASGAGYRSLNLLTQTFTLNSGGAVTSTANAFTSTYQPATYVFMVDDPVHPTYGAEVATLVPSGGDFLTRLAPATLTVNSDGLTDIGSALDGQPATYATNTAGLDYRYARLLQEAGQDAHPMVGIRILYSLSFAGVPGEHTAHATLEYQSTNTTPNGDGTSTRVDRRATFEIPLPDTNGELREVQAVIPMPLEILQDMLPGPFTLATPTVVKTFSYVHVYDRFGADTLPADRFRLYTFDALGFDRTKLDTLARKALVPPAQEPTEFTLPYLTGVIPTVVLTGAPGGDLTGDVVEIEGRHGQSQDGQAVSSTTLKLEQPGASETARIIRLAARERAADAQAELLDYLERP